MQQPCDEARVDRPVIIAHSSMRAASDSMVERGADFALDKQKGQPTSATISATFASLDAIEFLRCHRRPSKSRI
jgi:hypothetical protein